MEVSSVRLVEEGKAIHYPTVPVWTLLPSGSVISGNLAPRVAEFTSARALLLLLPELVLADAMMVRGFNTCGTVSQGRRFSRLGTMGCLGSRPHTRLKLWGMKEPRWKRQVDITRPGFFFL